MHYQLEVCAYNLQSALAAERAGAQRVELCSAFAEGGTTPSFGTVERAREKLSIALYPIIRPRAGHFRYDEDELAIIRQDILQCKTIGCDGIATGIQAQDGSIDTERMKRVVEWAFPMKVTCHRVFDTTPDPFAALEALIDCGCERILSSGHQTTAVEGIPLLTRLVQEAGDRIIIMPGSGVRSSNLEALLKTGAAEYHTSARRNRTDPIDYRNPAISGMGEVPLADEGEVAQMLAILSSASEPSRHDI